MGLTYADVIRMAEREFKKNPPSFDGQSLDAIRERIDAISAALKGPGVDAFERLMLDKERRSCREEIARREDQP